MGAKIFNSNFAPIFFKMGVTSPKLCTFGRKFADREDNFRHFSDSPFSFPP